MGPFVVAISNGPARDKGLGGLRLYGGCIEAQARKKALGGPGVIHIPAQDQIRKLEGRVIKDLLGSFDRNDLPRMTPRR